MYDVTTSMKNLQAELADCDRVLQQPLRAMWAVQLVDTLLGGRSCAWCVGYRSRHASRFVAVLLSDGTVAVWQTSGYQLDTLMGIITPTTTIRDVWRMKQQHAWRLAVDYGLSG